MLLLELERALFKFNAPTPPLEVLLKFDPRNGTAIPTVNGLFPYIKTGANCPSLLFLLCLLPAACSRVAIQRLVIAANHAANFIDFL